MGVGPVGGGCCQGRRYVLTALDLQGAVLLVQRVAPQVHHTGGRGGDPGEGERGRGERGEGERVSRVEEGGEG